MYRASRTARQNTIQTGRTSETWSFECMISRSLILCTGISNAVNPFWMSCYEIIFKIPKGPFSLTRGIREEVRYSLYRIHELLNETLAHSEDRFPPQAWASTYGFGGPSPVELYARCPPSLSEPPVWPHMPCHYVSDVGWCICGNHAYSNRPTRLRQTNPYRGHTDHDFCYGSDRCN